LGNLLMIVLAACSKATTNGSAQLASSSIVTTLVTAPASVATETTANTTQVTEDEIPSGSLLQAIETPPSTDVSVTATAAKVGNGTRVIAVVKVERSSASAPDVSFEADNGQLPLTRPENCQNPTKTTTLCSLEIGSPGETGEIELTYSSSVRSVTISVEQGYPDANLANNVITLAL
jgi:hypothetical protein